jgi:hemolysin activation/secretion protein
MPRRPLLAIAGSVMVSAVFPAIAFAQSSTGAPTREEIERAPTTPLPAPAQPRIGTDGLIERAPCPLAGDEFKAINFTLTAVDFGDLKGVSLDTLAPSYARFIGQSLPVAKICDIRDEAATILRAKGYLAAVQVPPQRITDGTVKFDVLFAKLVDFQVRGNAGKAEGIIAGYLGAIKEQPVFNIIDAERYLLLARDIPGYDVRLTLRPAGTVPGEVIGEVAVVYTPFELEANAQNYGSRDVGRIAGLLQARLNGIFGAGDRTTVGFYSTSNFREQHVLQLGEEVRIGREGLTLAADFTYAWTRPTLGAGLDLRSKTLVASLEARYPLVRRQAKSLIAGVGFDYIDQRARFVTDPLTTDKLRIFYGKLSFDAIDGGSIGSPVGYSSSEPLWRVGGSVEVRQGVDVFSASKSCGPGFIRCNTPNIPISRIEGDPTAFVARASGYIEYRPIPTIAFTIAPRLQYSPSALLSYEEFSAGNFSIGRGYDPGTLIGDSGVGVASEIRLGSLVPQSRKATALQAYGFFDAAWVWNKDSEFNGLDPQKLFSVGGGVRVAYGDRANLDIGGAFPLKTAGRATVRQDARLLVSLTVKLIPWSRR